jgi:hypothetical protein
MFSNNMSLNNEWYLPSEPCIKQIFVGESSFNVQSAPSTTQPLEGYASGDDQSLSKLPTEREAVGKISPTYNGGRLRTLTMDCSGIWRFDIAYPDRHKSTPGTPAPNTDPGPFY